MNAKNTAAAKLQEIINKGVEKATKGVEALQAEYQMRKDLMIKPNHIDVSFDEKTHEIRAKLPDVGEFDLTQHSRGQFLARAGLPTNFVDKLVDFKQYDLIRHNVKTLMPVVSKDGVLFRTVGNRAKGVLSSSYRKIDASPIFENFVGAAMKSGLVPHDGLVTDTRAFMSFLRPELVEITKGEFAVLGMEARASDYGRGAVELCISLMRLLCSNGMIGFDLLRKIHIGKRFDASEFDEANVIDVSARTVELDEKTVQSAMLDVVGSFDKFSKGMVGHIQKAAEEEMDVWKSLAILKKAGLKKSTIDMVKEMYESPLPIELVPEAPGKWRFANIVSMLANKAVGDEQKDLQDAAFSVMMPSKLLAA